MKAGVALVTLLVTGSARAQMVSLPEACATMERGYAACVLQNRSAAIDALRQAGVNPPAAQLKAISDNAFAVCQGIADAMKKTGCLTP